MIKVYLRILVSYIKWMFHKKPKNPGKYERKFYKPGYCQIQIVLFMRKLKKSHIEPQEKCIPISMDLLKKVQLRVTKEIPYKSDKGKDFWQTAEETIKKGRGDCEDQAILKMHYLREAGISESKVMVVLIEGHAFCGVQFSKDDFWVLDNGNMTLRVVKASELFPNRGRCPLCGFGYGKPFSF